MSTSNVTDCGIPHVGKISWGSHLCHFFQGRQDLVGCLVPYFRAGLENDERCIWVTAEPLPAPEAKAELSRSMHGLDRFLEEGQILILDSESWYARSGQTTKESVIDAWLQEEKVAALGRCTGLRIAGNLSFLKREEMASFLDYERAVNRIFPTHQIVALCSYDLRTCESGDLSSIIRAHHFTLGRTEAGWEILVSERGTRFP
jgi:hypothetical protein